MVDDAVVTVSQPSCRYATHGMPPRIRRATLEDVESIVAMLANDPFKGPLEQPGNQAYEAAFSAIDGDPRQVLVVLEANGEVIGVLQLTVIPGLAHVGATRAQLEGIHVREDQRGRGLGQHLIRWALGEAQRRGCSIVQLTADTRRTDAMRFYERLGFIHSHHGMKREI